MCSLKFVRFPVLRQRTCPTLGGFRAALTIHLVLQPAHRNGYELAENIPQPTSFKHFNYSKKLSGLRIGANKGWDRKRIFRKVHDAIRGRSLSTMLLRPSWSGATLLNIEMNVETSWHIEHTSHLVCNPTAQISAQLYWQSWVMGDEYTRMGVSLCDSILQPSPNLKIGNKSSDATARSLTSGRAL